MSTIKVVGPLELKVPSVPNFVLIGVDHDGVSPKITLGELSDDAIKVLGEAFTKAMLERAKEQRKARGIGPETDLAPAPAAIALVPPEKKPPKK